MKSGKHFNASESLDNLPLTHPEHFGTPVGGRRRGRVEEEEEEESSEAEEANQPYQGWQTNISVGTVCCSDVAPVPFGPTPIFFIFWLSEKCLY